MLEDSHLVFENFALDQALSFVFEAFEFNTLYGETVNIGEEFRVMLAD